MKTKYYLTTLLLTLTLLGLAFNQATAKEVIQATLSGPGLAGEIQLSETAELKVVSAPWFEMEPAEQPADLQEDSFFVLRLEIGAEDQIGAAQIFHYYPGNGERPGYFYYAECQGCSGSFQDWYRLRDQDDLTLRSLLVSQGAPAGLVQSGDSTGIRLDRLSQPGVVLPIASLALIALLAFAFFRSRVHKRAIEG
jgi:hypothetical protein